MTTQFGYPTSTELRQIEQDKLPNLTADRPIFQVFPIEEADTHVLQWEQEDNFTGLQAIRGLDGAPRRVSRTSANSYLAQPGSYGEYTVISERELTTRRREGSLDQPIDVTDLVMRDQDHLLGRRLDRIEYIGWQLLANGTFSVSTEEGTVAHTDSFNVQPFNATTTWATQNTSTPLQDLRNMKLLARGHSVRFDSSALAFMNSGTLNSMLANGNSQDLYGRRTQGFGTINSPAQLNELLAGDNLPRIVEYDGGYLDNSGTFQLWIPDHTVLVIGKRTTAAPIAAYRYTRNINNDGMAPGAYTKVVDKTDVVPRSIQVHDGHNGGPVIYFPSAIVKMSV